LIIYWRKKINIMKNKGRRDFLKKTAIAGVGLGLTGSALGFNAKFAKGKRIGMIGLDTGHSPAFAKSLNDPLAGDKYNGYKVVAAVPAGTDNIIEWKNRIPEFTKEVQKQGVEIVNSIEEMLALVDVVLLTCIDGNKHLEQVLPVFEAGKPVFIDKPFAGSLTDAYKIAKAAKKYNVPMFSSSSLRYIDGAKEIAEGKSGKVIGADAYSPAHIEEHHPDLFWYAVHGVETLFTVMGTGCISVTRTFNNDTDVVVGVWEGGRIGTFRGIRKGKGGYGVTVFGEKGISHLNKYSGYEPLLVEICKFYETGISPVSIKETLEIFAFMQAAEESKLQGGISVELESVIQNAN
jgi:predicted dehydrogenase